MSDGSDAGIVGVDIVTGGVSGYRESIFTSVRGIATVITGIIGATATDKRFADGICPVCAMPLHTQDGRCPRCLGQCRPSARGRRRLRLMFRAQSKCRGLLQKRVSRTRLARSVLIRSMGCRRFVGRGGPAPGRTFRIFRRIETGEASAVTNLQGRVGGVGLRICNGGQPGVPVLQSAGEVGGLIVVQQSASRDARPLYRPAVVKLGGL